MADEEREEWFCRTTWSDEIRDEFFGRLQRCRAYNRAQRVIVQGKTLALTERTEVLAPALELLSMAIREWPEDLMISWAHQLMGQCYSAQDDIARAVGSYRNAVQSEREKRNVQTQAPLDFGWLVATIPLADRR